MLENARRSMTLEELVESGDLEIGDIIPFQLTKKSTYVSQKEKNGYKDQEFSTNDLETSDLMYAGMENGLIKTLVAEPFGELTLRGATGYVYGVVEERNNISKSMFEGQYGVVSARSITIEDVNELTGEKPSIEEKEFVFDGRSYSPESFLKGEYEQEGKSVKHTAYHYEIREWNISEKVKDMLLRKAKKNTLARYESYGLASRAVSVRSNEVFFCVGYVNNGYTGMGYTLFDSHGSESDRCLEVRPVVYLDSKVTLEELVKEKDKIFKRP